MKYLVCQFKDEDGELFITTRNAREKMISVLIDLNQPIESVVLKEFETYDDASKYKSGIEYANKQIKKL